jgi:hypothetical protein
MIVTFIHFIQYKVHWDGTASTTKLFIELCKLPQLALYCII